VENNQDRGRTRQEMKMRKKTLTVLVICFGALTGCQKTVALDLDVAPMPNNRDEMKVASCDTRECRFYKDAVLFSSATSNWLMAERIRHDVEGESSDCRMTLNNLRFENVKLYVRLSKDGKLDEQDKRILALSQQFIDLQTGICRDKKPLLREARKTVRQTRWTFRTASYFLSRSYF